MRCQDVAWVRGALSLGVVLGSRCEAVGVELNARPGELGGGISPSCGGGPAGGGDIPPTQPSGRMLTLQTGMLKGSIGWWVSRPSAPDLRGRLQRAASPHPRSKIASATSGVSPPDRSTQQATGHGASKTQNYYCSCYSHYHSSSHYHKFSQLGYGQQPQDEFKKESSGGSTAALAVPLQLLCPHSPDRIGSKLLGGV